MNFTIWKEIENFNEKAFLSWLFLHVKNFMDKLPLNLVLYKILFYSYNIVTRLL
jgi:hypothetical protein